MAGGVAKLPPHSARDREKGCLGLRKSLGRPVRREDGFLCPTKKKRSPLKRSDYLYF